MAYTYRPNTKELVQELRNNLLENLMNSKFYSIESGELERDMKLFLELDSWKWGEQHYECKVASGKKLSGKE